MDLPPRHHHPLRRIARRLLLGLLLLLPVCAVHAHPHAWIDLRVTVFFNGDGHIAGLHQAWLIDPFYSLVLMEEMAEEARGDTLDEKMADIGNRMITNLEPYAYFTEISHGEKRIAGTTVSEYTLARNRGRLELSFTLNLKEPLDPAEAPLTYAVFDPGYWIEILHDPDVAVALEGASERCGLRIIQPRPDPALIARAAALGADQEAEPGLGRHFTERGEIRCDPAS